MSVGAVGSGSKVNVGGEIAIKVLKDQLKAQANLAAAMTQPTMVYDGNGNVSSVPPKNTIDTTM